MNNFLNKIGKEWEQTLFTLVLLLMLCYLGFVAYNMMKEEDGSSNNNVIPKDAHVYFDTKSFAYLEPAKLSNEVNPLLFHAKVTLPPPPPRTETKKPDPKTPTPQPQNNGGNKPTPTQPQTKPDPKTPSTPTPNNTAQTKPSTPSTPPKPTPPPPPPRKISIQYRGFVKGDDAQVAFYSANDSKTKKTEAKSAQPGAKIHGVLEIKKFDASSIVLSHNGKEITVQKGKKQEIVVQ